MVFSRSWAIILLLSAASTASGDLSSSPFARELALVDSLDRAGNRPEALQRVEPVIEAARADGDSFALAEALRLKGRLFVMFNRISESEQLLRESLALSTELADTNLSIQVLTVIAFVVRTQGRRDEARAFYRQLLDLSTAAGIQKSRATAMQAMGDDDREAGRFDEALAQYGEVLRIFEEIDEPLGQCTVWLRIGACKASMGDLEAGRDAFARVLDIGGGRDRFQRVEMAAAANIAQIELNLGDPASALAALEQIYETEREIGSLLSASHTARNIVEAKLQLGQASEANAILEELLPIVEAEGMAEQELDLKLALAAVQEHEERFDEATALYRWILARPEKEPVEPHIHAVRGVARCLSARDRSPEAMTELEAGIPLRDRGTEEVRILYDADLASALLEAGRHDDALVVLQRLDRAAEATELHRYRVGALVQSARCHLAADRPDSAVAALERAADVWERERTVPLDHEWRALRGADALELGSLLASLRLRHPSSLAEGERQRRAYDALQRFKARTLLEQLVGPGGELGEFTEEIAPTTVEELQNEVLQPGELLLDFFLAEPVMVCAITPEQCRVVELEADERSVREQLHLYRRLVATPPGEGLDESTVAGVTDAVSELILGPVADLLDGADRLIFAPSGATNLVPLSLLHARGSDESTALLETHRLARVPSATLLAWYRRQPASSEARERKLLAITGGHAAGRPSLPGAQREAAELARRYRGVTVREPSSAMATAAVLGELANCDIVHVSAHTFLDDERPWHSGVVLGVGEPAELPPTQTVLRSGENPGELMLRASDIVGLDLDARLAVLSACDTAAGRIVSGEGVQGLTTAFLGAGVRSVVATLWPVDDATTAVWVEAFYRQLADGASAAESLRRASLALRSNPATAHPFHWAGFVLVGDGETTVELETRRNVSWVVALSAFVIVLVVAAGRRRRRARDLSRSAAG